MKRVVARVLMALALVLPLAVLPAPPADAGWNYWSQSSCRPEILWQRRTEGVYYYNTTNGRTILVHEGPILKEYEFQGWECGWLGIVTSDEWNDPDHHVYQQFEHGYIYYCCWA